MRTAEKIVWYNMKYRCHSPVHRDFPQYGGRGIEVCREWRESFEAFLADMGPRPSPRHSIERKDNNAGYCKANCVWATKKVQARNRRTNRLLTLGTRTQTLSAWAEECGLNIKTLYKRLLIGWDISKALTTPVREYQ